MEEVGPLREGRGEQALPWLREDAGSAAGGAMQDEDKRTPECELIARSAGAARG